MNNGKFEVGDRIRIRAINNITLDSIKPTEIGLFTEEQLRSRYAVDGVPAASNLTGCGLSLYAVILRCYIGLGIMAIDIDILLDAKQEYVDANSMQKARFTLG